jgi:acetyl esterase/lipase
LLRGNTHQSKVKTTILCMILTLAGIAALAQPTNRPAAADARRAPGLPEGTRVLRDVAYVDAGHERQKLDLFIPPGSTNPVPVIIWVHGGGWMGGSKEQCPALAFLKDGYAVASINYRLSQHAVFPAQIEDCKAAVRWLRAHAKEYNLDPNAFAAWGASAGGHLVALLGTAGDVTKFDVGANPGVSSAVQVVVDFFGPTDFSLMAKQSAANSAINHDAPDAPEAKLIGGPVQDNKDKVAAANPITYVTPNDSPFLIMHGDKDNLVPYQQSEILRDALQKTGVPVTFKIIPGAGHGFGGAEIDRQVAEFLAKQLRHTSAPR